jgi:hypothetical protein
MARAIALAQNLVIDIEPLLRAAVVGGCAVALIFAGQPLPL